MIALVRLAALRQQVAAAQSGLAALSASAALSWGQHGSSAPNDHFWVQLSDSLARWQHQQSSASSACARQLHAAQPAGSKPSWAKGYVASAQPELVEEDGEEPSPRRVPHGDREPFRPLQFDNPQLAFESKSTGELMRAYAVFTACQMRPLVENADMLLKWSKRIFGKTIVNRIVKHTFFHQFCAGESQEGIKPRMAELWRSGIGGILDYAAEDDVSEEAPASRSQEHSTVVARTFDYADEAKCDSHMHIFLESIAAAAQSEGQGFAAIKLTALGNPKLLERTSAGLKAIDNLFAEFDLNHDHVISHEEFNQVYSELFSDCTPERMDQLFRYLDKDNTGYIDFLSWSRRIRLQDVPLMIKNCKAPGPLYVSALSEGELRHLNNMMGRLYQLAEAATAANVRLMIDAEHSYFQPAIDHAVLELQRVFNAHRPTVFNTIQCYTKDSWDRLCLDTQRAQQEGWLYGAKLVRGAYMQLERERARQKGYPSPIWDDIQQTHDNYNRLVDKALSLVAEHKAEFMIASHNQESIEKATKLMYELDLPPQESPVYFGQLLGMADPLSFVLGANGYKAYKYVPFGEVEQVIPYLVRRAQENSSVLGGVEKEKKMVAAEVRRRLLRRPAKQEPALRSEANLGH
ncbi:hypothetical protein CVIRNUC_001281 [Coccomyxa viridis]|uniref:Proline dehydrogenase n=1 Tax=Coccomyxa viridis TaxID=1274662 RepID=A0AAV1HTM2_9CHLO|nr:hypothetical protein CVIRNUC_001281 [Coccomyxa viridis]